MIYFLFLKIKYIYLQILLNQKFYFILYAYFANLSLKYLSDEKHLLMFDHL